MKLTVIIASTRPGRLGLPIGNWFYELAGKDTRFEVRLADLAEINLPFLDEPSHPKMQQYTKEHTRQWSKLIDDSDAFVIVSPEYNFSAPATIINAIDFLYNEWNYKAVGFVTYGGISGGTRSMQHLKNVVTTVKLIPVYDAVNIPFVNSQIEGDRFVANEKNAAAASAMLEEIYKVTTGTKKLRAS